MSKNNNSFNKDRRKFLLAATAATGAVGLTAAGVPFVTSMTPSEKAKAAGASVEVDISKVEKGQLLTTEWRGQPVWVLNRTDEMINDLSAGESNLADPKLKVTSQQPNYCQNETRSIKSNMLVVVGICTHLGCSPTAKLSPKGEMGESWPGGFFCPCHGSKFDLAGRVYKGSPAPTNLVVPPHRYNDDNTLVIGEDKKDEA
jgi:ubiquinol-cytochrome c reductase iron-sulfur subunit